LDGLSDTCGSPQNLRLPAVYRLPAGKYASILTEFQAKVNKKGQKISHR